MSGTRRRGGLGGFVSGVGRREARRWRKWGRVERKGDGGGGV